MKSPIHAVALAVALAVPLVSYAQTAEPVTRAHVREEMKTLQQAGYNPNDWLSYPQNIQAAEAKVARAHALAQAGGQASGYGHSAAAPTESGR